MENFQPRLQVDIPKSNLLVPLKIKSTDSISYIEDPKSHKQTVNMQFFEFDRDTINDLENCSVIEETDEDYSTNEIPDDLPIGYNPQSYVFNLIFRFSYSGNQVNSYFLSKRCWNRREEGGEEGFLDYQCIN